MVSSTCCVLSPRQMNLFVLLYQVIEGQSGAYGQAGVHDKRQSTAITRVRHIDDPSEIEHYEKVLQSDSVSLLRDCIEESSDRGEDL